MAATRLSIRRLARADRGAGRVLGVARLVGVIVVAFAGPDVSGANLAPVVGVWAAAAAALTVFAVAADVR
jgi:hypothetical protein